MKRFSLLVALFLACATTAAAQNESGSISGTVRDEQGGVLPGVVVTLQGVDATQSFTTATAGEYRFLSLAPVVKMIADEQGLATALVVDDADESDLSKTDWVLVTRNRGLLARKEIASVVTPIETIPGLAVWTDDYNNLFRILKK